jgi:hypothetical protein
MSFYLSVGIHFGAMREVIKVNVFRPSEKKKFRKTKFFSKKLNSFIIVNKTHSVCKTV